MEDMIGSMAYFTPAERELTGFDGPRSIEDVDMRVHHERIRGRRAFVQGKLAELNGDYEQYHARTAELEQLEWDEATLMDIEFDITKQRSAIADALFDKQLNLFGQE
ncbi:MAG: hypothetical protein JWO35_334 [Candidatus Saccharibacteria bacterium]|nr:hypothetical protein [Candidatus Saccharibacteria bacterium]